MAPRRSVTLATYYVWPDLLYGPDHRCGALLWPDACDQSNALRASMNRVPDAVVAALRTRSGQFIEGHLPGGLAA